MQQIMDQALAAIMEKPFPKPGDLLSGKVLKKEKNRCLLDLLEGQAVGIISGREIHDSANTYDRVQEGDLIKAVVVEDENDEGFYVLSFRKAAQNTAWDRFEIMFKKGEVFEVKSTEANKGGLLLEIDSIKAFLPVSQLAPLHYPRVNEANTQEILRRLQKLIGIKFRVRIIALDRENGKLILSERAAEEENRMEKLKKLKVGDTIHGKVSGIVKFGLFVAFDGLEGLVHISEIAWGHVRTPSDFAKLGDSIDVQIIGLEGEKISLSIKRLQKDPWIEAAEKYQVGTKVRGKINRITTFGAFITLDKDINGLIHLSEVSHEKVDELDKVLKVGQEVEAVVITIDLEEHRIGLSMKALIPVAPVAAAGQEAALSEPAITPSESSVLPDVPKAPVTQTIPSSDELLNIPGITKKHATALTSAGYTLEKLKNSTPTDLETIEGIGPKTAEKILAAVKE